MVSEKECLSLQVEQVDMMRPKDFSNGNFTKYKKYFISG